MPEQGRVLQVSVSEGGVPKRAVDRAWVGRLGVDGDRHRADTVHGGPLRAVCLFSMEAIERLQAEGHPVEPGSVGENLTTIGVEWSRLPVGTRARVGDRLLLELTWAAMPCDTQRPNFTGGRVNRISVALHPSDSRMYARVLEEGEVRPGDPIELLPPDPVSDAPLLDRLDRHEGATAAGFVALWRAAREAGHDVRFIDDGDLAVGASAELTSPLFNDVVTGMRTLPQLLPRVLDHYRAAGAAGLVEAPEPPWPGAVEMHARSILAADPGAVPEALLPDGLAIRQLGPGEWQPAAAVRRASWAHEPLETGIPDAVIAGFLASRGVAAFVAEADGEPLAVGGLVTYKRVGWFVMGAVVPAARGRGLQRALIAARASAARVAGCDLLAVETTPDSTSEVNLRRMGFERLRVARTWWFDPTHDPAPELTERPTAPATSPQR
jgi:MOSC domain-containing protein YiiM/ribosomal protein S18 acetylase RimI-like enzyme